MSDATTTLRALVDTCPRSPGPVVVGVAGGVAAGKTTLALALADALTGRAVEVVATDGFLYPNTVLRARGLQARKGFPESYDVEALRAFLAAARAGQLPRRIPCYSHTSYDVDGDREVPPVAVLVVEGLNVLSAAADLLDVGVYLDADEADLETWYRRRFLELRAAAANDPSSFYRVFAGLDDAEMTAVATEVWQTVNLPNLRHHIAPSASDARVVIRKGPDHAVRAVEVRDDGPVRGPEGR